MRNKHLLNLCCTSGKMVARGILTFKGTRSITERETPKQMLLGERSEFSAELWNRFPDERHAMRLRQNTDCFQMLEFAQLTPL